MRGKGPPHRSEFLHTRITPAYAGKRLMPRNCPDCHQDHPRLCGEKLCWSFVRLGQAGSPPPMRGKVQDEKVENQRKRITPAYAGKRLLQRPELRVFRDHPRLCGEKQGLLAYLRSF